MKMNIAKILGVAIFMLFVLGCKKNDGKGRFYLSLKSVNGNSFKSGEPITFDFDFSHPNNEVQNDTLFFYSKFYTCPYPSASDVNKGITIPEYTSTTDLLGKLTFDYKYGNDYKGCSNGGTPRKDSANFYFWLRDKNGKYSDTVVSNKIILAP